MAVIGTIRNRLGVVLVIFVGLALVLFVLEGLLSSSGSLLNNGNNVAEINGETVTVQEFEQMVQQNADRVKQNNNGTIDNAMMDQVREQSWNQLLNQMIFGEEYEALGLSVSPKELLDMVQGNNIHPQVRQAFTDPKTGQFSTASVVQFIRNLDEADEVTRNQWLAFENSLREERIAQKYQNLIGQSLYVTSYQAKQEFIARNKTAKVRFVFQNYNSISDSSVKVDDSELKAYYDDHKKQFNQPENSRRLEYVVFDVAPSKEDREYVENKLKTLNEEFKATKDDSAFVMQNSDIKMDEVYYKKGQLPPALDTVMFNAPVGTMAGPFADGEYQKISKLIEVKTLPDSVKARHILLQVTNPADKEKVMARADSIKKAIKGGASFAEMAMKFSADQGSAIKGGDLGTFGEGMMVKPFNDASFNGNKGDMPIVESQFGIHLIEIQDQKNPSKRARIATLALKLEPSSATKQALYAQANEFAAQVNNGDFTASITKKGLAKREGDARESDRTFAGLEDSREIIKWAYRAKKDETSKVFDTGNQFIVAHLTEIREKGILPLEQVKEQVKFLAVREKKGRQMSEKLSAQLSGATTIDAAASKAGLTLMTSDAVNFSAAFLSNVGREPEVVGRLFSLKQGQLSAPIKGNTGVFVVQVDAFTEPVLPKEFGSEKTQIMGSLKQRTNYEVFNVLKEKAEVKDNRIRFY
jgi:peptidyl-prolyl cis-trans isomerase D